MTDVMSDYMLRYVGYLQLVSCYYSDVLYILCATIEFPCFVWIYVPDE